MTQQERDSKYMAIVLTETGFIHWEEDKELTILDVKPEFRNMLGHEFLKEVKP